MNVKHEPEFECLECGHVFETSEEAEVAAYDEGCPDCGSVDIDIYAPQD